MFKMNRLTKKEYVSNSQSQRSVKAYEALPTRFNAIPNDKNLDYYQKMMDVQKLMIENSNKTEKLRNLASEQKKLESKFVTKMYEPINVVKRTHESTDSKIKGFHNKVCEVLEEIDKKQGGNFEGGDPLDRKMRILSQEDRLRIQTHIRKLTS